MTGRLIHLFLLFVLSSAATAPGLAWAQPVPRPTLILISRSGAENSANSLIPVLDQLCQRARNGDFGDRYADVLKVQPDDEMLKPDLPARRKQIAGPMALMREEVEKGLVSCLAGPEGAGRPVEMPGLMEGLVAQVTRDQGNVVNVRLMLVASTGTWPASTVAVHNASQVELGSPDGQNRFVGCLGWTVWRTRAWIPPRTDCRSLGLNDAHGHLSLRLEHGARSDHSLRATIEHAGGRLELQGSEFDVLVSVEPGAGEITVHRDGFRAWHDAFEVAIGREEELRPRFHRLPMWPAIAAGSVSALGLGVGVVSSFQLRSSSAEVEDFIDTCASGCNWDTGRKLDAEARGDRTRQNVSYLVSAVFLTAAAIYWYLAR